MDEPTLNLSRLDGITTKWSVVRRAHAEEGASVQEARQALVMRYASAIRNYTRAIMRGDQDADEMAQDFVMRMLQGDFSGADPDRGRFRDLLKTAVRNMIRNHWAKQKRRRPADYDLGLVGEEDGDDADAAADPWLDNWRTNLLELAWSSLDDYERANPSSAACTLLRLRVEKPDLTSDQLAAELSAKTGREVKAATVRQQLRRARLRFAEMLVDEIASGIDEPDPGRVQDELIALGLYEHVRDLLPEEYRREKDA